MNSRISVQLSHSHELVPARENAQFPDHPATIRERTRTIVNPSGPDRHRGGGHPPTPATPPCVRVRTRRFELVTLASIDQRWKSERFEVSIRKPHREGFSPSQVPRAASATRRVASQSRTNSQLQQCGSAPAWCFPLPPQGCTQAQPDPTSQVHQHIGRFTETEIAAPAPETGS